MQGQIKGWEVGEGVGPVTKVSGKASCIHTETDSSHFAVVREATHLSLVVESALKPSCPRITVRAKASCTPWDLDPQTNHNSGSKYLTKLALVFPHFPL